MVNIFTGGLIMKERHVNEKPGGLVAAVDQLRNFPGLARPAREAVKMANLELKKRLHLVPFLTICATINYSWKEEGSKDFTEGCLEYMEYYENAILDANDRYYRRKRIMNAINPYYKHASFLDAESSLLPCMDMYLFNFMNEDGARICVIRGGNSRLAKMPIFEGVFNDSARKYDPYSLVPNIA